MAETESKAEMNDAGQSFSSPADTGCLDWVPGAASQ